jgi:hypothetical protein
VWLGVGSGKVALSRLAHQRVTRAVRRFLSKMKKIIHSDIADTKEFKK